MIFSLRGSQPFEIFPLKLLLISFNPHLELGTQMQSWFMTIMEESLEVGKRVVQPPSQANPQALEFPRMSLPLCSEGPADKECGIHCPLDLCPILQL